MMGRWLFAGTVALACYASVAGAKEPTQARSQTTEEIPAFSELVTHPVRLRPELEGVHPRVFVTADGLTRIRQRARTSHRAEWAKVISNLTAVRTPPPPAPGPQERRSQNNVAFAVTEISLAYAVEQKPEYLDAAKRWTLAAIDYEPWGYTYNKPNVDLAAGHLLYALGWAYDLLYPQWSAAERGRIRASLERHAALVYDYFAPAPGKHFNFTQNHDFIPTAGLAVAALALMGESADAPKWAALARAHHHRAGQLLSPDGYYYESMEYWIFSAPWLVHFLDAWEHATGESLWDRDVFRNWKYYLAHVLLPDGQNVFDFGDIWEGPLTRAKGGAEYDRVYPGGTLQSNFNIMYRVAARFRDPEAQAVAERYATFRHSNLEEYWTLLWRDDTLASAPMSAFKLAHHFTDSGVVFGRTSWATDATAFAFRAGPPEGHRVAALRPTIPEWRLSSGHAHPDANTFIIYAAGRYLTGDTGYAGLPTARTHNTITVGGVGQGVEGQHDVWAKMDYRTLDATRIVEATLAPEAGRVRVVGEASSSYPTQAGLTRFRRTFTFEAPGRFLVRDDIDLSAPRTVEWYLHSDDPIRGEASAFRLGDDRAGLEVSLRLPPGSQTTTGPTWVMAPGAPGSIEKGSRDQRGYEIEAKTPADKSTTIEATMVVKRGKD